MSKNCAHQSCDPIRHYTQQTKETKTLTLSLLALKILLYAIAQKPNRNGQTIKIIYRKDKVYTKKDLY